MNWPKLPISLELAVADRHPGNRGRLTILTIYLALLSVCGWAQAQTPVISALSKGSAQPGDTITITGSNFAASASDNIVAFGAEHATVLSASSTQLQVQVPAGATFAPVTVRVPGGKTASSVRPFVPVFSPTGPITDHSFGQTSSYGATNKPPALVTVATDSGSLTAGSVILDVDGDGKPDIAVAEPGTYSVRILRNVSSTGALTAAAFTTAANLVTGISSSGQYVPADIAFGDLDGDGKPDLAVANESGGGTGATTPAITILQNASTPGAVSFLTAFSLPLPTGGSFLPDCVKIVDIDGDGWPDIVCCGDQIIVYRNKGTGGTLSASSFAAGVIYSVAYGEATNLAVADLDGDGKPDLVVTGYPSQFWILRNTSTPGVINAASFASPVAITTPAAVSAVAAVDLDGDGKPEVLASSSSNMIYVYPNQCKAGSLSAASFGTRVDVAVPNYPNIVRLSVADLNGDGWPDVMMTNRFSPGVIVAVNSGSGSVTNALTSFVSLSIPAVEVSGYGASLGHVAIGDLNGNGKPDLVVDGEQGSISISENFVVPLTVNSLAISPASTSVKIPWYRTAVFTVSQLMSDGSKINVSNGANWTSSTPGVATVDAMGTATGVAVGTTVIQASSSGKTAQAALTVQPTPFGQSPGNPDGTFLPAISNGSNGGAVYALAVQSDGKVVIGGLFSSVNGVTRNNLARINDDGSLDTTFDPGTGPNGAVHALSLDSSGRVLVGGQFASYNGTTRRVVARVLSNGALDTTFAANFGASSSSRVDTMCMRSDGRILLGGYVLYPSGSSTSTYLAQLNTDGSVDTTFIPATASGELNTMTLQPDGSLLIGGYFSNAAQGSFCLGRLTSTGVFDTNFQIGIKSSEVFGIALQPDGKVVAVGDFSMVFTKSMSFVTRLNSDGTLDDGFSPPATSSWGIVKCLALQKNGRIVVSKSVSTTRLNADGTLDSTYNSTVQPDWDTYVLAVGANEKIWDAGGISSVNGAPTLGIARLQGDVTSFLGWQSRYFSQAQQVNDPAHSGANGDVAGDGVPNLVKYALGVDAYQSARGKMPTTSPAATSTVPGTGFDFTYPRRIQATDLLYAVGVSYDLQTWDFSGAQLGQLGTPTANPDGVTENVTLRLSSPAPNSNAVFFRLKTSIQP